MPFSRTGILGQGVTNGDSHDHSGGDGAQIDHDTLSNINSGNILAGLAPTFAGWSTDPGTAADLVDELTTALTTPGVQTNALSSDIIYDLGSSMRVSLSIYRSGVATSSGIQISLSDDNITYYPSGRSANSTASISAMFQGKGRYIQVRFNGTAAGNTISNISIRAYRV